MPGAVPRRQRLPSVNRLRSNRNATYQPMKRHPVSHKGRLALLALVAAALLGGMGGCAEQDAATRAHQALLHSRPFKSWLDEANYDAAVAAFEAKDYATAYNEWLLVADTGDGEAEFRLGTLSEEGLGVPQNYVEAHRWYNLAAAAGLAAAPAARDALAAKMTKEQLGEAQRLAAQWRPTGLASPAALENGAAAAEAAAPAEAAPPGAEAVAHFKAGLKALKAETLPRAIAEFNAGLALSPDADAFFLLGEAYRLAGESEQAIKAYDAALALDPRSAIAGRARDASAALAAEVEVTAAEKIAEVQRMLKLLHFYAGPADGKANPKTMAAAGAFARKQNLAFDGRLTLAFVGALKTAADARLQQAAAKFRAGGEALKAKQPERAIKELGIGLALADDAQGEFMLGEAYRQKGEDGKALERYRRSLALDAKSPVAGQALEAVRSLVALAEPQAGGPEAGQAGEPAKAPVTPVAREQVASLPTATAAQPPAAPSVATPEIEARIDDIRRQAAHASALARAARARASDAQLRAVDAAARARNGGGAGLFAGAPVNTPGDRYEGGIDANMQYSGYGIYYFASGDRVEGEFGAAGTTPCDRIYHWADGAHYEGEFKRGSSSERDGYGVYTTADGRRYEGQWAHDRMVGYMLSITPDGAQYEGEFHDNLANGRGILLGRDGKVIKAGIWRNGQLEVPFGGVSAK